MLPNYSPFAQADATPDDVLSGESVTLDGANSFDIDGQYLEYQWSQTDTTGIDVMILEQTASQTSFIAPDTLQTIRI